MLRVAHGAETETMPVPPQLQLHLWKKWLESTHQVMSGAIVQEQEGWMIQGKVSSEGSCSTIKERRKKLICDQVLYCHPVSDKELESSGAVRE